MLFVCLSDAGIVTQPIEAATLADAADQIRLLHGGAASPVRVALLTPQAFATVIPNPADPTQATLQITGDALAQKNIRDAARDALVDNAAFLVNATPTQAEVLAQVRALTRQSNGLIRLMLGQPT